jgi:hypothetical protein
MLAEIPRRGDAVVQVVLVDGLVHAHRDRLEVATAEAPVGGKTLGEDEQVFLLTSHREVACGEEPADVDDGIFLGAHRAALGELREVVVAHGASATQVALAWLLARDDHVIAIPGATRPEHVRENAGALSLSLSEAEFAAIDRAAAPTAR